MVKEVKSPLRYPGGKSLAIKFLKNYFPNSFSEYREPFFGGGSVGIHIAQNFNNVKIVANDINYNLYCFWESVQKDTNKLVSQIKELKKRYKNNGRGLFNYLKSMDMFSDIGKATYFYILNRITFSGLAESGGYSEKAFLGRFTDSCIDRLEKIAPIIKDFKFYNKDFAEVIAEEGSDVFMYLDPPYYSAVKSKLYGKRGSLHTQFNHERLFKLLQKTNHKFIMTYDNNDYIKDLYKNFYILE